MHGLRRWLHRVSKRWRASKASTPLIDDPRSRIVVESFDDTEAASSVLSRAPLWKAARPAVLRHHLVLPESEVELARTLLESDGWQLRRVGENKHENAASKAEVSLVALRVQHLDALHCAQESARMAGLAQRLGGRTLGWDAFQPEDPAQPEDSA